jgi:hypothetical protein
MATGGSACVGVGAAAAARLASAASVLADFHEGLAADNQDLRLGLRPEALLGCERQQPSSSNCRASASARNGQARSVSAPSCLALVSACSARPARRLRGTDAPRARGRPEGTDPPAGPAQGPSRKRRGRRSRTHAGPFLEVARGGVLRHDIRHLPSRREDCAGASRDARDPYPLATSCRLGPLHTRGGHSFIVLTHGSPACTKRVL